MPCCGMVPPVPAVGVPPVPPVAEGAVPPVPPPEGKPVGALGLADGLGFGVRLGEVAGVETTDEAEVAVAGDPALPLAEVVVWGDVIALELRELVLALEDVAAWS